MDIKFNSFQYYLTNCNNDIDSIDYLDDLVRLQPDNSYFNEPDWGIKN